MSAAVEADGVRKEYGSLVALEDLTFEVETGEILGVLGPNGAGKTTAIRVLTTILSPTRGSFRVAGTPHTRPAEIRTCIGVLPESAGYPEHQTGEEFLRFYARLYGCSRASAAAAATALLAEVEELCTRVLILNRGRVAAEGTVSEVARMAAAPRSARVRVPAERVEDARGALARATGVESVETTVGQPGGLVVAFASAGEEPATAALLAVAVPVLGARFLRLGGGRAK